MTSERGLNKLRYTWHLLTAGRKNSNCSRFVRNRVQLSALLEGPVIDHVRRATRGIISIAVLGCSYGPEPVSIASSLNWKRPDVAFHIDGYDIDKRSLNFAREGKYEERHVCNHRDLDPEFVAYTFTKRGKQFVVTDSVHDQIDYHYGDATNENLSALVGKCDIIFAQHFLYHLDRKTQAATFERITGLLPPHGVLFVDGIDLDIRARAVRKLGLQPLDYKIREIHECSRETPWARSWPHVYYGLEPLVESGDWKTRYATIFTRRPVLASAKPPRVNALET